MFFLDFFETTINPKKWLEPGRTHKRHYHIHLQKYFLKMVIFTTIASEAVNCGDTFLPRP